MRVPILASSGSLYALAGPFPSAPLRINLAQGEQKRCPLVVSLSNHGAETFPHSDATIAVLSAGRLWVQGSPCRAGKTAVAVDPLLVIGVKLLD